MAYHVTVVLKGDSNERHVIKSDDTTQKFSVALSDGFLQIAKRSISGNSISYTFAADSILWYRISKDNQS